MKLLIDIDDKTAEYIKGLQEFDCEDLLINEMYIAIKKGRVVSEGGDKNEENHL